MGKKFKKRIRRMLERRKKQVNKWNCPKKFCKKCGIDSEKARLTIHHKIPQSLGGTNDRSNLQVLCFRCHKEVHNEKR
jgi:5-methylcytosine-specific restriction endonuclease McrA